MQKSGIQHSNVEEHATPRHREEPGPESQSMIGAPAWRSSVSECDDPRTMRSIPLWASTPQVKARRCREHVHPVNAGEARKMAGVVLMAGQGARGPGIRLQDLALATDRKGRRHVCRPARCSRRRDLRATILLTQPVAPEQARSSRRDLSARRRRLPSAWGDNNGLVGSCDSPEGESDITYQRYTLLLVVELDIIVVYHQTSMSSFSRFLAHTVRRLVQGSQEWLSFGAQLY